MTYMQAALTILAYADRPLTIGEITAVAVAQELVRPRGKTPDRTMASILYRRMAADPDAPIVSRGGRFWLRGRLLPADESTYLAHHPRHIRVARHHAPGATRSASTMRRPTMLPAPPLRLPDDVVQAAASTSRVRTSGYAPTRRERAVARAGERAAGLLARLAERRSVGAEGDAAATATRLVTPLLRHLGYHRGTDLRPIERSGRGVSAYLLHAGGAPAIALDVRRLTHDLGDDDAWRALGHAQQAGAPYAAATNGREVRVYSAAIAQMQDDPAAALVLALDLTPAPADGDARAEQAAALWLLSRQAVAAGALDAYAANRAVGAALLDALDAPDSPLARALVAEVGARTGVVLPASLVLRHARLALRGRRGRDGEPLPEDVPTVSAVRGPRLARPGAEAPQSA
jgi:HB1, ASXL, restriction endonuclease HTH domain